MDKIMTFAEESFEPIWCLDKENPQLFEHITKTNPWLKLEFYDIIKNVPLPPTYNPFDIDEYFRPSGHSRSFYKRAPDGLESHICFKGGEVCLDNIAEALAGLNTVKTLPAYWHYDAIEYFAMIEKCLPMALCKNEAFDELSKACYFQQDYLTKHGDVAQLPVPLMLLAFPSDLTERLLTIYEDLVAPEFFPIVKDRVLNGVVFYVYYLPGSPLRLKGFSSMAEGRHPFSNFEENLDELETVANPLSLVNKWHKLVAEILSLGYLPTSLEDIVTGGMCMSHNTTMSGGFCDLNSLRKIEDIHSDHEVYQCLNLLIVWLTWSVQLLYLRNDVLKTGFGYQRGWHFSRNNLYSFMEISIDSFVWNQVATFLAQCSESMLDSRVKTYFSQDFEWAQLDAVLEGLYPGVDMDDELIQKLNEMIN